MEWLTPTRRAVRWSPTIVALSLAGATLVLIRLAGRPLPSDVFVVTLAMVVLGAVCGLDDPAREFVHAMPVSAARRLAQRLVVLVPVVVLGLLVLEWLATTLFTDLPQAPGWRALTAYGAVGVAACVTLTRRLGSRAVEAAAAAMLGWLAFGIWLGQLDAPVGAAMPWLRWPLAIGSSALVVTMLATSRGVEA
jgi:hypothetical protein